MKNSLIKYQYIIKLIRLREVLLMVGFFYIGSILGFKKINEDLLKLTISFISCYLLVQTIYLTNIFLGITYDVHNSRHIKIENVDKYFIIILSLVFIFFLSTILIYFNFTINLYIAIFLFLLWFIYSLPRIGLKHFHYWGTLVHFISGITQFNFGYLFFEKISYSSILLSLPFALLFSIGHLNHEIIDYDADLMAKSKTTAVRHGVNKNVKLITYLSFLAILLSLILYFFKVIDQWLLIIFFVLFSLFSQSKKLLNNTKSALIFRSIYRTCTLILFSVYVIFKIINAVF